MLAMGLSNLIVVSITSAIALALDVIEHHPRKFIGGQSIPMCIGRILVVTQTPNDVVLVDGVSQHCGVRLAPFVAEAQHLPGDSDVFIVDAESNHKSGLSVDQRGVPYVHWVVILAVFVLVVVRALLVHRQSKVVVHGTGANQCSAITKHAIMCILPN